MIQFFQIEFGNCYHTTRAIQKVTANCTFVGRSRGSDTALLQTHKEGQSASNRGAGKVLHLIIGFLCFGKMTAPKIEPTKC